MVLSLSYHDLERLNSKKVDKKALGACIDALALFMLYNVVVKGFHSKQPR